MSTNRRAGRQATVAGAAYFLMIICIWGCFATSSGMPYETAFAFMSETSQGGSGFLYRSDSLRIYTNVFYHLSYLLGRLLGISGSFSPYQVVYAGLWWARGMLAFLISRRLVPNSALLSFTIGAFVVVHASDGALQWVGQMNQFGYIFWLLLALYMLIVAFQQTSAHLAAASVVAACLFEYMCLWSYESGAFIVCAAPVVFALLLRPKPIVRSLLISGVWYTVPITYLYLTFLRDFHSGVSGYQEMVMRKTWSPGSILGDLAFNMQYSLSFWSWTEVDSHMRQGQVLTLAAGALLVFLIAGLMILRLGDYPSAGLPSARKPHLWYILAVGIIFLILSFPAYLLLAEARSCWRTQFLSGIGTAMILGAAVSLIVNLIPRERFRSVAAIMLSTPIIWAGAHRAIELGGLHRSIWQRHRHAVQEVIRAAPRIEPGTVLVMTNVSKAADPFGDDYWFDMALRLIYPRTPIAGIYYYDDGTAASGDSLQLRDGQWKWDGKGAAPLLRSAPVDHTLVIEYEAEGNAKVQPDIPPFLCSGQCSGLPYQPLARIAGRTPSPEALRRYGPL